MAKISAGPFELLNGLVSGFQSGSQLAMQQQEMAMKRQAMDFDQSLKTKMQELEAIKTKAQIDVWNTEVQQKRREDFIPEPIMKALFFDEDTTTPTMDPNAAVTSPSTLTSIQSTIDTVAGFSGDVAAPGVKPAQTEIQKGGGQVNAPIPIQQKGGTQKTPKPPIMRSINSLEGEEQDIVDSTQREPASIIPISQQGQANQESQHDDVIREQIKNQKLKDVLGEVQELEGGKGWYLGKGARELLEKRMGSNAAARVAAGKGGFGDGSMSAKDILAMAAKQKEFKQSEAATQKRADTSNALTVDKNLADMKTSSLERIHSDFKKRADTKKEELRFTTLFLSTLADKDGNMRDYSQIMSDKKAKGVYQTAANTIMKGFDSGKMSDKDVTILQDATKGNLDKFINELKSWFSTGKPLTRDSFEALNTFVKLKFDSDSEEFSAMSNSAKQQVVSEIGKVNNPTYGKEIKSKANSILSDIDSYGKTKVIKSEAPKIKTAGEKAREKKTPIQTKKEGEKPTQVTKTVYRIKGVSDQALIDAVKKEHGPNTNVKIIDKK